MPFCCILLFRIFAFLTPYSSHYLQWLTAFVNVLQIPFLVCKRLIWPAQIDPNYLYYHCRFYFRLFTHHPLQVLLFEHRWGHSLASFRPHYWSLTGSFCPLKLLALTYPSVAESIFDISPFWPPAAPNTQQRPVVFISALYPSFLVCICLFTFILIDTNDLHYRCICYFRFIAFPTPWSSQCSIKIFGTHLWYVNHSFGPFKLILNPVAITSTQPRLPVSRNWEYHRYQDGLMQDRCQPPS